MLAAVIERPGAVTVRQVPVPQAGGLALVRVGVAGICGTDRKLAAGAFPVAVNPAAFCGLCRECRRDLPQLCGRGGLLGRDLDGCFAEYVAVPETLLHPLPAEVTADQAALIQVLSTCVHAQSGLAVSPDCSAAVIGLGASGLLHLQLLRARGVRAVVGVTRAAWKHDLALACGACLVVAPDDAAAAVAEVTGGHGADIAIESAGTAATLAQAIRLAGPGATVIAVGAVRTADGLPAYAGYLNELTVRWPRASRPRDFDTAIRLCADGRLDLAPLVTGRFPLPEAARALAASADPEQLKVVLDVAAP